jgi:hypothetical protein
MSERHKAPPPANVVAFRKPSALPARWTEMSAAERLDALVDHPHPEDAVAAVPAEELFYLVKFNGAERALDVLEHLSPEQWQAFVDIDGWEGEAPCPARLHEWLAIAEAANTEAAIKLVGSLDAEYLTSLLQDMAEIYDRDFDPAEAPDDRETFQSPDGYYWILVPHDHPDTPLLQRLLRLMYASDPDEARAILLATRTELPTALEEEARRFREGRLNDLGFPAWADAMQLTSSVDPAAFRAKLERAMPHGHKAGATRTAGAPAMLARLDESKSRFLRECTSYISDPEALDRLRHGVQGLVRHWLIARKRELGSEDSFELTSREVYGVLGVGTEFLAREDVAAGAWILENALLRDIFRAGYALLSRLARRAASIRRRVGGPERLYLLSSPAAEVVTGLCEPFPQAFVGYDANGSPLYAQVETLSQLQSMTEIVREAEAVLTFFERAFGFGPKALDSTTFGGLGADSRAEIRLDTLFLTALANAVVLGEWKLEPLSAEDAGRFAEALLEGEPRRLRPEVRTRLVDMAAQAGAKAGPATTEPNTTRALATFVNQALQRVEDELESIPGGDSPNWTLLQSLLLVR